MIDYMNYFFIKTHTTFKAQQYTGDTKNKEHTHIKNVVLMIDL